MYLKSVSEKWQMVIQSQINGQNICSFFCSSLPDSGESFFSFTQNKRRKTSQNKRTGLLHHLHQMTFDCFSFFFLSLWAAHPWSGGWFTSAMRCTCFLFSFSLSASLAQKKWLIHLWLAHLSGSKWPLIHVIRAILKSPLHSHSALL